MGSEDFANRFSPIRVFHLPRFGSDHAAILILLEAEPALRSRRRKHLFRFEECWAKDARCENFVKAHWGNPAQDWDTK
ncbi:hypothetical protein A2U01_0080211, partial [Trifolium medium]|nr:hypothetical protein [Trifolium medium]